MCVIGVWPDSYFMLPCLGVSQSFQGLVLRTGPTYQHVQSWKMHTWFHSICKDYNHHLSHDLWCAWYDICQPATCYQVFCMIWAFWNTALQCSVHMQACWIASLERSNQIYSDYFRLSVTGWLCFPRLDLVQPKALLMMAWVPETDPGHMHWCQDSLSTYIQRLGAFTMITVILPFHLTLCILCRVCMNDLLMWWLLVYLELAEPSDCPYGIWDMHHLTAATYTSRYRM
jgi:hypothetical protein